MHKNVVFKAGLVVVLLIGTAVISSTGMNDQSDFVTTDNDGTLSGYVADPLDNPIEGALIRVDFHETYEEDYSDENGYYYVDNIPICYCMKNVSCSKEGYKTEWVELGIVENTIHDFVLHTSDVYPVFEGSQCNGWWNSPVTVSFVFDPEEVAEIHYSYNGNPWQIYTEPFVICEEGEITLKYYWIDHEGHQSSYYYYEIPIDQTPPSTDITWEVHKEFGKWYVKFTLIAVDAISGMAPYLDFYLNDVLQETFYVFWPVFEFEIQWNKILEKVTFGFGCSDNACNFVIEEVNGSDIHSQSISYIRNQNHFHFYLLLQILQQFKQNLYNKMIVRS